MGNMWVSRRVSNIQCLHCPNSSASSRTNQFVSLTFLTNCWLSGPRKTLGKIWRLGTKWLFGHHPTAMGAYLDAWRLKPEPNLEWDLSTGPSVLHRHVEKRHVSKKNSKNFHCSHLEIQHIILKNRLEGPILYVFLDDYICFLSHISDGRVLCGNVNVSNRN